MYNRKIRLAEIIELSIIAVLSMVTKPYVRSAFALFLTGLAVPVGVFAGGFYMAWVVLAGNVVRARGATALFCTFQGILALFLGMSGGLGPFVLVSYILPGVALELLYIIVPTHEMPAWLCAVAGAVANVTGSVLNSVLMFQLKGKMLAAWAIPSLLTGAGGGYLGYLVAHRLAQLVVRKQVKEEHE